ncbi:MAG: 3-deoxy-D-manno-octulosonic acid transferase [Proteobacteria bacterium]|nr:3-deoxy-D-manno-octulosonic acid transferase [Pseudomonadota bacterium]MBU1649635.1 3-deoxy-D-manno-octulosonic acid transferase [Pseudomonadota bacterium]MBU1986212.1 3-deoxy-D-manno-octulosonic acid transferase [Pseudomonadota bacterium]
MVNISIKQQTFGDKRISTQPPSTRTPLSIKIAMLVYQLAWNIAIPFLRRNQRLYHGFSQRTLEEMPAPADLWIQAASVGESFLAGEVLRKLDPAGPIRVLLTTYTSQGMEILEKARNEAMQQNCKLTIHTAYFPFDHPGLMTKAVTVIRPKVMLLLESELWPGLLASCRQQGVKVLVANGRMTAKSFSRYRIWPSLWRYLRPERILAISSDDASRFATLFGMDEVEAVPNIKFDRISEQRTEDTVNNPLAHLFPPDTTARAKLLVLGSVREEEEADIIKLICHIRGQNNQTSIALFPRHMHRIKNWEKMLETHGLPWQLRSRCTGSVSPGSIILWDTMGEMLFAYQLADAAFVGGSLAPLGGQNFLEPLTCGLRPVIGPHWSNFLWIGRDIIDQQLVFQAQDWQEAADILMQQSSLPPLREQTRQKIITYVKNRRGGTDTTCTTINNLLFEGSVNPITNK